MGMQMLKENSRIRFEFGEQSQSRRKRRGTSKGYQAGGEHSEKRTEDSQGGWPGIVHPAVISSGTARYQAQL